MIPVGIHSGADEIGAGFAGVAADKRAAGGVGKCAADEKSVVRVVLEYQEGRSKILVFHSEGKLLQCAKAEYRELRLLVRAGKGWIEEMPLPKSGNGFSLRAV